MKLTYKKVLSIAGSDCGGGAGIQADLKTISAFGCYGMSVLTALTAQNTKIVQAIHEVPLNFIEEQMNAIFEDLRPDAIKIGMLHSVEIIKLISSFLIKHKAQNIVLDPVMVSKGGQKLLQQKAIDTLKNELIPIADVITPNIPEANDILNVNINNESSMIQAAEKFIKLGCKSVVIKGGHLDSSESNDLFLYFNNQQINSFWFKDARVNTVNTHGTGCTFSSAIASGLAKGYTKQQSVQLAKKYISAAISEGSKYKIGEGHGPVHHMLEFKNILP